MSNTTRYTATAFIVIVVVVVGLFQLSKSTTIQVFGEHINRLPTDQKVVALTFDDAPLEHTTATLDILEQYKVPATFFAVGKHIEERPEVAQQIVAQGHQLANHSYSHPRFLFKSQSEIDTELSTTTELIRNVGFKDKIVFRPPYGKRLLGLPWYLDQHDIPTIMWDVDPGTHHAGDAQAMYDYTLEHVQPGSIILLHPDCANGCEADREILPKIISELQYQGYEFVTVNQLLTY